MLPVLLSAVIRGKETESVTVVVGQVGRKRNVLMWAMCYYMERSYTRESKTSFAKIQLCLV